MMPTLAVLLLLLVGYAATTGHFMQGLHFMFDPDFSKLTTEAVIVAMGHAFFSLSLGMGAIMAYGAYMPHGQPVQVTTSIGLACLLPADRSLRDLLDRADQALYQAKASGRNRVISDAMMRGATRA